MSDIQRYDYDKVWGMEKNEIGDYVQYDDHAAIVAQLEADIAEAKKVMQEISKLHDHEMSGNEIRMNAYDMACLARKFLSDAAIKEQGK
jgi:hypothetical protein